MNEFFGCLDAFLISIFYQILLEWVNFVGGKKRLYVNCFFNRLHKPRPKYLWAALPHREPTKRLPKISEWFSTKNETILGFTFYFHLFLTLSQWHAKTLPCSFEKCRFKVGTITLMVGYLSKQERKNENNWK